MDMEDNFQFQGQRRKMIQELKTKGIYDDNVLNAMGLVPRHFFFEPMFRQYAYEDRPFSIGGGQTISQPSTVACQSQLLEVKQRCKVLEIGTGSGYQAAILDKMGAKVYTIERIRELYVKAKALLEVLSPKVKCYFGDGYKGIVSYAPYDRIIVTAAAPSIPEQLFQQLKVGGKMIIPVDDHENKQIMLVVDKISETEMRTTEHGSFSFVPMLENIKER